MVDLCHNFQRTILGSPIKFLFFFPTCPIGLPWVPWAKYDWRYFRQSELVQLSSDGTRSDDEPRRCKKAIS